MFEFNQDYTTIVTPHENDIKIHNVDPFKLCAIVNFKDIKIKLARMYFRTNLIFFVGVGDKYSANMLNVYDDYKKEFVGEIKLENNIEDVKCVKECVAILSADVIYFYKLDSLLCVDQIKVSNKNFSLSPDCSIAYIDKQNGVEYVKIKDIKNAANLITFEAHQNDVEYMTFNNDGTLLATASTKGTIIRIYNSLNGTMMHEFRRGLGASKIHYITFNHDSEYMAVISNKGTVHIYNLKNPSSNRKSMLKGLGGYFDSTWSFAWYNDEVIDPVRKCCFNKYNDLIIINGNHSFRKITFDKNGGECKLVDKSQ